MDIINKIDSYLGYAISPDTFRLMEIASLEDYPTMDEGIADTIVSALSKVGVEVTKERGLIDMIKSAGKKVGIVLAYAFQAAVGRAGAVERLKKAIEDTHVTPGDIIDFLLKVDQLTVGSLTIPIRQIEAITGWKIRANIGKKYDNNYVIKKLDTAIKELEYIGKELEGSAKRLIENYIIKLKDLYKMLKRELVKYIKK